MIGVLASSGLTKEELKDAIAKLDAAIATNALTTSQKGAIASTLGLGTAFKGLGIKINDTTASMITWMATNPVGWVVAVVSAIGAATYGVIKLHDALTVSLEEQKEKLQETKDAYENVKSELQELETELQNAEDTIKELEYAPNLSWVEQEELNRLREATKELELQKQLKQEEKLKAAEDLYRENENTFNTEFSGSYGQEVKVPELKQKLSAGEITLGTLDLEGNITDMIATLQYLEEARKTLTDTDEIADYDSYIKMVTENMSKYIKENGTLTSLSEYKQNLREIAGMGDLTEDEQAFYDYLTSMQKAIYEFYSPDTWNTIEIDSIFRIKGLEKTKEELIAMYKADALSPEMLESFPKLSEAIQESEIIVGEGSNVFKEVFDEIAALADKTEQTVNSFDLTSYKDQIDNFQSKIKTLSDTLTSLNDGTFTHSSLVDLLQEFPELTGKTDDLQGAIQELIHALLEDLYSALGENVPTALRESLQSIADEANNAALNIKSIPNAISDLQSIHDLIQTVSKEMSDGGISASTLQNIAGKYSQLEDAVNAYCAGLLTEQELYARLQEQYNADYEAFQVANKSKMYENELFFEMSYGKNSELVNELARKYELDLKNFKTVEAAKLAGEKKLLGDMAGIWSKYYSIVLDKDGSYKIEGTAFSETYDAQNSSEYIELEEKRREIQSFLDDLNESFKPDNILTLDYTPGSLSGSSSSAKETKEFSEELNWTEKLINRVSSALGKLKDKVSNTYIGWSVRNHSLSKAMEKTNEAINVQRQAYEQYMQKAASAGLSQEYVNKIQNGSLDIETVTDESLADQIKEYETWYDNASDCSDAIEELKTQLAELARQKFDNINTHFRGLMDTTEYPMRLYPLIEN